MLINAFRGEPDLRNPALALLSISTIKFYYGPLLKLEAILQPTLERRRDELEFYEEYFKWAHIFGNLDRVYEIAEKEALRHGIKVLDAMHVAAAHLSRCDVLITAEKPEKPIFRTKIVNVARLLDSDPESFRD